MISSSRLPFRLAVVLAAGLLAAVTGAVAPVRAGEPSVRARVATAPPTTPATAPAAAARPDPVIVGAGDIAGCAEPEGAAATAAVLDHLPGTIFTLGDNTYINGTPQEYADCFDPVWGRLKPRIQLPVAGNHDYNTPGAAGYFGYFGAAAGDPAKGYYDTTIGTWHVVVLNTNCEAIGGCGAGSPQEQWLRGVLAASDAACTIALWHEPAFSSATVHRAFPLYRPLWQALYDYGAEIVLDGSDHVYERFAPQTPAGDADPDFGIRQFTVGTGGRSHQLIRIPLPNSEVRNGGTYGALSLTLHPDSYDWQFVPEAGKTFTDSGTGACHGAPPAPPPAPGPVVAVGSSSGGAKTSMAGLTIGRPAGTEPGQVMVASIVSDQTDPAFGAPPGWTVVESDAIPDTLRQTIYTKVAAPDEPDSYTWTVTRRRQIAGGITTYAGVDPDHPVDTHAARVVAAPGTTVTAPSVTTTVPGDLLVEFAAVNAEGIVTAPDGMAPEWLTASPTGGTTDALAAAADEPAPTAGPTGPRTATATEPGGRIAVALALRPAPGPPTDPTPSTTTPATSGSYPPTTATPEPSTTTPTS